MREVHYGNQSMDHLLLNWANIENLKENAAFLSETQNALLNTYQYKLAKTEGTNVALGSNFKYYKQNVPIVIMADPTWAKSVTFCYEKVPGNGYFKCRCLQRKYCQWCARYKASLKTEALEGAFKAGYHAYFLTLSYKNNLFVTPETKREDITSWWEYAHNYFNKLPFIKGAFNVDEIAVQNITERVILPHTHCLILSDRDDLCHTVTTWDGSTKYTLNQELFPVDQHLVPYIEPVTDEASFRHHIVYMIKAINFHERYEIEWSEENALHLNNSTSFLINHLTSQLKRYTQVHSTGIMHPHSKLYVGTKQ